MEEAKENEQESRVVTSAILTSLALPRSPLISIQNPPLTPKSAQTTPKFRASCVRRLSELPPLSDPRTSTRESRGCARRILESGNLSKSLSSVEELVEAPCFELNEDLSFWKDRNVRVLIRIRPIGTAESSMYGYKRCLTQDSPQSLTWIGNPETRFTFDHIASESISQEKLFRAVGLPMVENCMSGYNGCMFAYGQTGSGKTYTMMGELREVENYPSEYRGMTPRIFEYLFARIWEEEEKRKEEKVKYNCRCSFLEIYNEHITDLLEPSSSNLQLREDVEKGVYVEGLKECEASSVSDIMALLLQGVANRRMAATNMNSESSRSHSVFTCIIESRWEKDSLTHLRFSRLNLVDLAGSERQKSSGAEGERLKEAANINKSLSTLGLVIMNLVDIANGKNRHVPYRDSRLTFLLQDSLGGNSKTIVLATVSPSICSSSETLSTLKFAQRAKLIQNNAKVNEDSLGDVMALQRQIQVLKDQLRSLEMQHDISASLVNPSSSSRLDHLGFTFGESITATCADNSDITRLNQKDKISNSETGTETNEDKSGETTELKEQLKFLTEENKKMKETIQTRDTEWETAIFDLTRFLSDGYDSLEDASRSIENVMNLFPRRVCSLERAIRVSLEREKLVHDLSVKLDDAKRIEREMESKLHCLRGATLAITELHERESDNTDGTGSVLENNSDKGCLEEVAQKLEKRGKHTTELLFQFEKAQETMHEAELMLSTLLHSTEIARKERDSLAKLQFSSLEETQNLVSDLEEEFNELKCEISEQMEGIQNDTVCFGHEVKEWVQKLRGFFANLPLAREIERKNEVVKGLCFDLRLLQESTSHVSDIREKYEKIGVSLQNLQEEVSAKNSLLDKMYERQEFLETELSISRSELERIQDLCTFYEKENSELETLLRENEFKNAQIKESLDEKSELIEELEREILSKNGNTGAKCVLSVRELEREIERLGEERDKFEREAISLSTKLEMAMALADEREAISVEARQEAETRKMHAEEKEMEVKVLERSIQELESTIDVLEGKVHDMKEEAESYQFKGKHLESQVKSLTDKITFLQNGQIDDHPSRNLELYEAQRYIEDLESEVKYRDEEIKQYKNHISELVLHSEAQSSLFKEKYKALEEMAKGSEASGSTNEHLNGEITEKPLVRTRGSGSPFKCMSSLVHQINMEKDKELSKARQRIQELETLLSSKQQEVCVLSARLAAVDSMTHDVIRDLLGVKLDITSYANVLDQEQFENLLVKSHQHAQESKAKDEEILNLRKTIDRLIEERESLMEDMNQTRGDILSSQMLIEELEQREKLFTTKNKILKMDKVNLRKKIVEMDEIIESMSSSNGTKRKEGSSRNDGNEEFKKRLEQSDKLLSHARHELSMFNHG